LMVAQFAGGSCAHLAGPAKNVNKWTLQDDGDATDLIIELNSGDSCGTNQNYAVTMTLKCDEKGAARQITWDQTSLASFDPKQCSNKLIGTSFEACSKVDFYVAAEFLKTYKWLVGTVMVLIGIFELFFGVKLMKFTTFLVSAIAVLSLVSLFFFEFIIPKGSNPNIVWVVLGIGLVLGLVLGFFLSKATKHFIALFGGYIGYLLGSILYTFLLSRIEMNQTALFWITIVSMVLTGLVLSYFFAKAIMITCTAFIGGYLFVRGISLYTGGFPDEQLIKDLMDRGEYDEINKVLNWAAYLYFSAWLILWIIGIIVQRKLKKEEPEQDDNKKITNSSFYHKMDN